MGPTDKELGDALQKIAEQFSAIDNSLANLAVGLLAVKATLALQMDPKMPTRALQQIDKIQSELARLDPNAPARQKFADAIEVIKLVEKYGRGGTS